MEPLQALPHHQANTSDTATRGALRPPDCRFVKVQDPLLTYTVHEMLGPVHTCMWLHDGRLKVTLLTHTDPQQHQISNVPRRQSLYRTNAANRCFW